jgi:hypothetical protein
MVASELQAQLQQHLGRLTNCPVQSSESFGLAVATCLPAEHNVAAKDGVVRVGRIPSYLPLELLAL